MFHVMVRNSAGHMISATRWQGLLLSSIVRCMPVENERNPAPRRAA